jgi:putative transcriptional regulator
MLKQMPAHHPSLDLLSFVAAGQESPAVHKVVLAHAALCADCRAELAKLESLGGAMLEEEPGAAMGSGALERALSAIADAGANPAATVPDWLQSVPDGVREMAAEVARNAGSRTSPSLNLMQSMGTNRETIDILRIEPGKAIPAHAHDGIEYTLVLTGAFRDQRGVFAQGDLAISDARHTHRPVAEPGETCIAIIATTAGLRFKGPLGLLQRVMALGRG